MPVTGSTALKLLLGGSGLKLLLSVTGPGALVLAVGAVAVGLTGISFFWWNKAMEYKMQEKQSSGYLRHVLVTTGIVTFLFIFLYCFTSYLTYGKNGLMSSYRN